KFRGYGCPKGCQGIGKCSGSGLPDVFKADELRLYRLGKGTLSERLPGQFIKAVDSLVYSDIHEIGVRAGAEQGIDRNSPLLRIKFFQLFKLGYHVFYSQKLT